MASPLHIRDAIRTPEMKRDYNARLFTRIAGEYDRATRAMSLGRDGSWKRRLVGLLPEAAAPRCVDLACGTGDVSLELAARFPKGQITGLDLAPAMIAVARQRCRHPNITFTVADMCRTGLPGESVDIVTGSYALRNAPVLDEALHEVRRILKPGGHAGFLDFMKSPVRWQQAIQLPLLKYWGGFWGMVIHGRPEHCYIAESLRQFPDRPAFRRQLAGAGFKVVRTRKCLGGLLEIVLLRRD